MTSLPMPLTRVVLPVNAEASMVSALLPPVSSVSVRPLPLMASSRVSGVSVPGAVATSELLVRVKFQSPLSTSSLRVALLVTMLLLPELPVK